MEPKYAFSLDGTNWTGSFASRKEARAAAFKSANQQPEIPGVIFVGRVRPVDPQASGMASMVIREMCRRFRDLSGDASHLGHITVQQQRDLDARLEQTIVAWLTQHHLLPPGQKIEAISEYPVPTVPLHPRDGDTVEVGLVGETPDMGL